MIFFHIDPSRLPNDWAPGTMSPRAKGGLVAVTVVVKADPTLSWMDGYLAWMLEGIFFSAGTQVEDGEPHFPQ